VNVGELGDGVAQGIVDLAKGTISAVYVGDGEAGNVRRRSRRECFNAVADDEDQVGLKGDECVDQTGHGQAGVACSGRAVAAGIASPSDHAIDFPSLALDRLHAGSVSRVEVHSGGDQLEVEFFMFADCAQDGLHQSRIQHGCR